MPSSSCFYLYTENLSLPVFLLIFCIQKGHLSKIMPCPCYIFVKRISPFASLLAHERSRFAICQWELSTPTDRNIPLTRRLVLRALETGECLSAVNRIFAIRFATCRITRNLPASGPLLMICHNRIAASQLIRSGLYHS